MIKKKKKIFFSGNFCCSRSRQLCSWKFSNPWNRRPSPGQGWGVPCPVCPALWWHSGLGTAPRSVFLDPRTHSRPPRVQMGSPPDPGTGSASTCQEQTHVVWVFVMVMQWKLVRRNRTSLFLIKKYIYRHMHSYKLHSNPARYGPLHNTHLCKHPQTHTFSLS